MYYSRIYSLGILIKTYQSRTIDQELLIKNYRSRIINQELLLRNHNVKSYYLGTFTVLLLLSILTL